MMIDTTGATTTDHYFLQESFNFELALDFNGMSVVGKNGQLGQQKRLLIPRSLKGVIKKGEAPLSMLDCIVLKKYPVYCLEFFAESDGAKSEAAKKGAKC